MGMFIRENKYRAGEYQEAEAIPLPVELRHRIPGAKRKRKQAITRPPQQNWNNNRSFKWMRLAMNGNFKRGDYYVTLTLRESELPAPDNVDAAKDYLSKFLTKARYRYKKVGVPLKYIWVMEYEIEEKDGNPEYLKRVHFHLVMSAGIDRDALEECWSIGNGKNRKSLGWVTTRRVQPNGELGLEALARYFSKGKRWKKGKKIWNSSTNLDARPTKLEPNDHKYTRRQLEKMRMSNDKGMEILSKKYQGWHITSIEYVENEQKGLHMYLKMWKKSRCG